MSGQSFVFHMAANADVKDGLLHPRKDIEQNVVGTQNVLEAMRAAGVRHIAFASTGVLYGDAAILPIPEDGPFPVQTSLYGASKVAAEGLVDGVRPRLRLSDLDLRFVSLLGPRYSHGHVDRFLAKLRRDPKVLHVLGDGTQKKSFLHVLGLRAARCSSRSTASPRRRGSTS